MLTKPEIKKVLSECLAVGTVQFQIPTDLHGAFTIKLTPEGSHKSVSFTMAVRSLTRDTREKGVWVDRLKIQKTGLRTANSLDALLGLTIIGSRPVFVSFDTKHHIPIGGKSPNVQCKEKLVLDAARRGSTVRMTKKMTKEVLLAFPGHLLTAHLLDIRHQTGTQPIQGRDETWYNSRRRKRDPSFRDRILDIYKHRCGVCRLGIDLPEAAHIVPHCIGANDSSENGVALCPNHHIAYDRIGLISFQEDRTIMVNKERFDYYDQKDNVSMRRFLTSLGKELSPVALDQSKQLAKRFEFDSNRLAPQVWCRPEDL